MPHPPRRLNFDHATASEKPNDQTLRLPAVDNSPLRDQDFRISANHNTARRTSNYDQTMNFAYGANPISDTAYCNSLSASSSANNTHDADTTDAAYRLAGISANAQIVPNLNLASFGSRSGPTTTGPYLHFAPRPMYEPTDEFMHETAGAFEHFDNPSSFRQATWQPEEETITTTPQHGRTTGHMPIQSTNVVNEKLNRPKSVLKRSREFDAGADEPSQTRRKETASNLGFRQVRRVSFGQMSGLGPPSADDEDSSSSEAPSTLRPSLQGRVGSSTRRGRGSASSGAPTQRPILQQASGVQTQARLMRGSKTPTGHPPLILPPEKVFPIQIGSQLFRLSGASISSDAPSYFTQFFEEQIRQNEESGGVRTLYIDRDPETFRDVARHLQGYYIKPRDGSQFVKLFADAQFYSLPRLINQLFESEIFIQIGEQHFQIPKDIFSDPGNSPNFFSLGFAVFFSTPGEVFPGLDRRGLLRPPSITPPYVPGRSAKTFAQLLHLLRGYPLHIKDEEHRSELLRDCRYFHLRGLEQKIIAHEISYNLERQRTEICLRIEDIKPSGISYKADDSRSDQNTSGWVYYARPFVDDISYELVVEIGGESMVVNLNDMRADFHGLAKARVSSLFQVVANKMNLPTNAPLGLLVLDGTGQSPHTASPGHTPLSEDRVKVLFGPSSDVWLDGARYEFDWNSHLGQSMSQGPIKPRHDVESEDSDGMSEGELESEQIRTQGSRARAAHQSQSHAEVSRTGSLAKPHGGTRAAPPRLDTASSGPRKRRRPTLSSASAGSGNGEWVIRSGQWRLCVQLNQQDTIRGGYEIVFIAVKLDAFSQERARNTRRKFLGGS